MIIDDIKPQEVQAIEVEAPHVATDLQLTAEVRAAVPLTQVVVSGNNSATQEEQHYSTNADSSSC